MSERYRLIPSSSGAGEFHLRPLSEPARPELWWHDATAPALVLGSNQPESDIDADTCERLGIDVVRRRSGGGAVLLVPGEVVWLDVIVPVDSPDWSPDVHAQMVWLGDHIAAAIRTLVADAAGSATALSGTPGSAAAGTGPATATAGAGDTSIGEMVVHAGSMVSTPWSRMICFDGVGAGEVLLGGHKLVGISQRRTRVGSRMQCCWYTEYDPTALLDLLAEPTRPSATQLRPVATLPPTVARAIPEALHRRLS